MVVGLVLEHEKPFLKSSVHIHIYINAARIVLFADFHIVEQTCLAEISASDSSHIHEVKALVLTAELFSHLEIEIQSSVNVFLHERLLYPDFLQFSGEGGMAAMVTPVCIKDTELSLIRFTAFLSEVFHHFAKVIGIHCQAHLAAERLQVSLGHPGESLKYRNRLY